MSQPLQEKLHPALADLKAGDEVRWLKELIKLPDLRSEQTSTSVSIPHR